MPSTRFLAVAATASALLAGAPFPGRADAPGGGTTPAPTVILSELTDAIPKTDRHEVRMLTATVQPGAASVWHTHRSPPIVYVIEGTFRLEMEGREPVTLTAGQGLLEPTGNVVMRAFNPGDRPQKLLLVQISAPGEPFLDAVER